VRFTGYRLALRKTKFEQLGGSTFAAASEILPLEDEAGEAIVGDFSGPFMTNITELGCRGNTCPTITSA